MVKQISTLLFSFIFCMSFSASALLAKEGFNLDFELLDGKAAKGWKDYDKTGSYDTRLDSEVFFQGQRSVSIEFNGKQPQFGAWMYTIPAKYQGKKVTLRGYLKTEDVTNGWAGLWMRIDPSVAFDNMQSNGVTGTNDWKQYEITLDLKPDQAQRIVIGGLLSGRGKVWLDNFELLIDGIPILDAPTFVKEIAKAEMDKEFDKGTLLSIGELDEVKVNNLTVLGKVWGLLKYYHPAVASGEYNWDYELFRILPRFLESKTSKNRDEILVSWIESLGNIPKCAACSGHTKLLKKPDLEWISEFKLSPVLQNSLMHIYQNRNQNDHYYIKKLAANNPQFANEKSYDNMPYPDEGFRLLAAYRYWNMIQYFFPYVHLMDNSWDAVLHKYIPLFLQAENELEYETTALQMVAEVQDSHANIWSGNDKFKLAKGQYYPPVHLRFIEEQLVVTDFYTADVSDNIEMSQKSGLEVGDVITSINGISVTEIVNARLRNYPGSNRSAQLRDMAPELLRANQNKITLVVQREAVNKELQLTLYKKSELHWFNWYRKDQTEKSFKFLSREIGYVTLANIKEEDVEQIKSEFKGTKGIIIDIRNYPSAFVPFALGSFFVEGAIPFAKFTATDITHPGAFSFFGPVTLQNEGDTYKGKVLVLVNELTQSQAEYTTMAFQAGINTRIVGSQTAGADGNISRLSFPGGLQTSISGIGVYYPDGTETQRVGIVPDIIVKPTIEGIRAGKDEVLERAILEIH